MRDPRRLARFDVHPVQVVVRPRQFVRVVGRGVDDVLAVLVPVRRPVDPLVVCRQRLLAGAVGVDDVELQVVLLLAVAAEDDLRCRPGRRTVRRCSTSAPSVSCFAPVPSAFMMNRFVSPAVPALRRSACRRPSSCPRRCRPSRRVRHLRSVPSRLASKIFMCGSKSHEYRRRTPFFMSSSRCLNSASWCFFASGSRWLLAKMIFLPSGRKKPQVVLPTPGLTRRELPGLQVHARRSGRTGCRCPSPRPGR